MFVLITTVPYGDEAAHDLSQEYRKKDSIERRFAFLKDPKVVDSVFVRKPERVLALGYVPLVVCLVFSILEGGSAPRANPC